MFQAGQEGEQLQKFTENVAANWGWDLPERA